MRRRYWLAVHLARAGYLGRHAQHWATRQITRHERTR